MPRVVRLCGVTFASLVIWSRIAVILHEVLGHAVTALLLGGHVERVSVSLFGGGHVLATGIPDVGPGVLLFDLSGIAINGLLGASLLTLAIRRRALRGIMPCFLALGAAVNLLGATHYAVLGAFYQFGDPAVAPWLWPPSLAASLLVVPGTLWMWGRTLPLPATRWGTALVVALLPLSAYAGAFAAERAATGGRTEFVALAAEGAEMERRREEAVAERLEQWNQRHPGEPPPPDVLAAAAQNVERPFPMTVFVLLLDVLSFIAALALRNRAAPREYDAGVPVALPSVLAGGLLLVCLALH